MFKDLLCARQCLDAGDTAVIQADTSPPHLRKGDGQETNKWGTYTSKYYKGNKWDGIKRITWKGQEEKQKGEVEKIVDKASEGT